MFDAVEDTATHARERAFILDQRNERKMMISTKVDKESSRKEVNLKWKKTLALQQMETKGVQKRRLTSVSDKCMGQECKTEDKDF